MVNGSRAYVKTKLFRGWTFAAADGKKGRAGGNQGEGKEQWWRSNHWSGESWRGGWAIGPEFESQLT
jgi:hypothetical protein